MEEDYIENDDDGNIFELIDEECYYDDLWMEEKENNEFKRSNYAIKKELENEIKR